MSEAKMSNADMAREFNRFDPRKYGVIDLAEWLENAKAERAQTLAEIKRLYAELDEVDKLLEIDRHQWRAPDRPAVRRDILDRLKVRSGELLAVDVTLGLLPAEESLSQQERERRIYSGERGTTPVPGTDGKMFVKGTLEPGARVYCKPADHLGDANNMVQQAAAMAEECRRRRAYDLKVAEYDAMVACREVPSDALHEQMEAARVAYLEAAKVTDRVMGWSDEDVKAIF